MKLKLAILHRSLRLRFLLLVSLILFSISFLLISVSFLYVKSTLHSLQNERGLSLVRYLATLNREALKSGRDLDLRVADLVVENDVEEALLFNRENRIAAPLKLAGQPTEDPLLLKALGRGSSEPFTQIEKKGTREQLLVSLPLLEGEEKIGTAVVVLSLENINKRLLPRLFRQVFFFAVFIIVAGGWAGLLTVKSILRSLADFESQVEAVGTSEGLSQVEIPQEEELASLGSAVNRMVKRIEARVRYEKKD